VAPANEIPAPFLGEWNEVPGDCGTAMNDSRLRVEPRRVRFYESDGEVQSVTRHNARAITVSLSLSGEGETWTDSHRLVLSRSGEQLTSGGLTRQRC
jgi:hypothetical protein